MIEFSESKQNVFPIGAIPGTAPDILIGRKYVLSYITGKFSKSKAFSIIPPCSGGTLAPRPLQSEGFKGGV